nr:ice-binding family protein [Nesterenkonia sp. YGD6]
MNNTTSSARSAPAVQRPHFTSQARLLLAVLLASFLAMAITLSYSSVASAMTTPSSSLGAAGSYAVLAGSTVTNTGTTVLNGDLGLTPGTAVTGFPPGQVAEGNETNIANGPALLAQQSLTTAYNTYEGLPATEENVMVLDREDPFVAGVYNSPSSMMLSGRMTLDGQNDPDSVFVFQAGSSLTTASGSSIELINGANVCNVYWQVGSSATLGTGSSFMGSILALESITVTTGTLVTGRALARNGAVTLDTNVFNAPSCGEPTTDPTEEPTETPVPTDESTTDPTEEPTETPVPTDEPTEVLVPTEEPTEVAVPTEERTDVPAATDEPTEVAVSTEEPTEAPVPTDEPTDSAVPTNTESPEASASPTESDAPSGSDSPTASDTTDDAVTGDDATESAAPSDSDDTTIEADASAADTDDDSAEVASDSSDLPSTGIGTLTSVLVGLSVLLILGGATLLIIRRQRSTSSD